MLAIVSITIMQQLYHRPCHDHCHFVMIVMVDNSCRDDNDDHWSSHRPCHDHCHFVMIVMVDNKLL